MDSSISNWLLIVILLCLQENEALSERYKEVYVELSELRGRSERDINALKEHLKLTDAALEEGRRLGNSRTGQWEHSRRS